MRQQDLEKVTVRLNRGDKTDLEVLFPDIGYNAVIRTLVHNFIKGIKEKAQKDAGKINTQEIDLSSLTPDLKEETVDA